jgi:hypothetical protein
MLISNPLRKLLNISCKKVHNENVMEKLSLFTFITMCKTLQPITFLREIFCRFSQWIQNQHQILHFALLANFEAKT